MSRSIFISWFVRYGNRSSNSYSNYSNNKNSGGEGAANNLANCRNPFITAVPLWGQTTQFSRSLSPKRDCGPKRVKKHQAFPHSNPKYYRHTRYSQLFSPFFSPGPCHTATRAAPAPAVVAAVVAAKKSQTISSLAFRDTRPFTYEKVELRLAARSSAIREESSSRG